MSSRRDRPRHRQRHLPTAGPEVSVASTKAFTCTLTAFSLLALHLGRVRDLGPGDGMRLIAGLEALPAQIEEVLATEEHS